MLQPSVIDCGEFFLRKRDKFQWAGGGYYKIGGRLGHLTGKKVAFSVDSWSVFHNRILGKESPLLTYQLIKN